MNKTRIQVILSIVILLSTVGFFAFGIHYTDGMIGKIETLREEIESKEIKIKRAQNLNASIEKTVGERSKILNYFIAPGGAIDFVTMLENVASTFKLQYTTNGIENIELDTLRDQDKHLLKINMTLSGGWKDIVKYILYIESLPYSLTINSLELSSEGVGRVAEQLENTGTTTKAVSSEKVTIWKLEIDFSVVKIKDKK